MLLLSMNSKLELPMMKNPMQSSVTLTRSLSMQLKTISAELVETMEGIENDTWMVWEKSSIDRLGLPEEQTSAMLKEETQEDYKAEETSAIVGLAEAVDGGIEVANEDELEEAGITHDAEESRTKIRLWIVLLFFLLQSKD